MTSSDPIRGRLQGLRPRRGPRSGRVLVASGGRAVLGLVAFTILGASLAACGGGSTSAASGLPGAKNVTIEMTEMRFSPTTIHVTVGDTVTFTFENQGKVRHEAVIGDQSAQDAAVAMMQAMDAATSTTTTSAPAGRAAGTAAGVGDGSARLASYDHPGMGLPNVVSVDPGQSGTLTFQFAKAGTLLVECHQPGHLQAGMKGAIIVAPA